MKSKLFRFGLSSILCVFVGVASVFAHAPPAGESIATGVNWGDADVILSRHTIGDGVHVHVYRIPGDKFLGPGSFLYISKEYDGGGDGGSHSHTFSPHAHGGYVSHTHSGSHSHANPSKIHPNPHDVDNDHSGIGTQTTSHSHTFSAHQHGGYVSHTHTGRHAHPNPSDTHSHPHIVDNDHSGVGTNTNTNSHTHTFPAHQHGNYVSHVHSGSHSGDSTVTHTDPHVVDNDHTNVGTQTPNNNPVNPVNVGGGTPAVGDSGTAENTSGAQQAVSSPPQATQGTQSASTTQPLRVTEYMVRDWGGIPNLPQWIELYNPNTEAVNLKDHTFQYATRPFANHPYVIHTLTLADDTQDGFSIAGGGVAILATQAKLPARRFSGIQESQVYALDIPNALKNGWVLTDASGKEVYRIGRRAFSALRDPVAPPHQGRARVSHHRYRSEAPSEPYYYGYRHDIGSPGFYEQPAPAAPSAVRRKRVGTWASLKRTP